MHSQHAGRAVVCPVLSAARPDCPQSVLQAQGKDLLGYVPEAPVTIPFDDSYVKGSDDLPLDQPPLAKVVNETAPEQIHIALAGISCQPPVNCLH